VSPESPGWTRRRQGRGFVYLDHDGRPLGGDEVARCKSLVIPPAWTHVWICPLPNGHLQAVGTDDAGRRQYLYHPVWRERRDQAKHDRVLIVARRLPRARAVVAEHLQQDGLPRQRVLATAFRLLDLGFFRVGGEAYAESNGSFGLATIQKQHVRVSGNEIVFEYPAKSGQERLVAVADRAVREAVLAMRRRRGGGPELVAYRDGRR
jgi:DNA topoisomerase IB